MRRNKNYANKATFQKVAFYRGVELFLDGDYAETVEVMNLAVASDADAFFTARARYWKAEASYLLNRFDEALLDFIQFQQSGVASRTQEFKDLDYNLGYTYFKLKDYSTASNYFKEYAKRSATDPKALDAVVRLGDCYFVTSKYEAAIDAYTQYGRGSGAEKDYAAFQKAVSYGFVGKNDTKISELNKFLTQYPVSTLKDDVLFELGNSYIRDNREKEGLQAYDQLVREYRGSSLVPQALLRQGLVHYNANRNNEALLKFKAVVSDFPKTQEAVQAVNTGKLVYMDMGRVNEYAAWVRNLDFVEVSDIELDNATYESANKQNLEGKDAAAIRGYENYLKEFPSGMHTMPANFALAQLYFSKGENDKALRSYQYVADRGGSEFSEQALTRVCELLLAKSNTKAAMPYLTELENTADIPQNRVYAQQNLMKVYFEQKEYARTLVYADKVLGSSNVDDRIRSDAHVMIARSAMKTGDEATAETAYKEVSKIASGSTAAEALYYDAYFKRTRKEYEASNAVVQKLAKEYASL